MAVQPRILNISVLIERKYNFLINGKAFKNSKFWQKIAKLLIIKEIVSSLNSPKKSVPLKLFSWKIIMFLVIAIIYYIVQDWQFHCLLISLLHFAYLLLTLNSIYAHTYIYIYIYIYIHTHTYIVTFNQDYP